MDVFFFSEARSNACCEKSADAIVDTDTSLPMKKKNVQQEALRSVEGQNLIVSE